jgi:sugar phosphate isomerase/epimerase
MLLADGRTHLTYCLNVHPARTWLENLRAIRDYALRVRDAVGSGGPFGLGLRLSAAAAEELDRPRALADFRRFLDDEGLYVFTINGFPYGRFHGGAVKANVYRPDWRTEARRDYTNRLAAILAELLPEGVIGSISTVPLAYRGSGGPNGAGGRADRPPPPAGEAPEPKEAGEEERPAFPMLAEAVGRLDEIRRRTRREIVLALEPEPDCQVEDTDGAIRFLRGAAGGPAASHLARTAGLSAGEAREVMARHLGVCLDTAHAAVRFEDPGRSLRRLAAAGVRVAKVQLSSALDFAATPEALDAARAFGEEVYLHQTSVRGPAGHVRHYPDLPEALADPAAAGADRRWRVHYHVPLYWRGTGPLRSTAALLEGEFLPSLPEFTSHAEIETYTFTVLPEPLRPTDLAAGIAGEYEWVLDRWNRR